MNGNGSITSDVIPNANHTIPILDTILTMSST